MRRRPIRAYSLPRPEALEGRTLLTTLVALVDTGVNLSDPVASPFYDLTRAKNMITGQVGGPAVSDSAYNGGPGHGSVVATLAVSAIQTGLAQPGAGGADIKILPVKVYYDNSLSVSVSALIAGVRYAADQGAAVINISRGDFSDLNNGFGGDSLSAAIRYAQSKGSVVVTAAGNRGYQNQPQGVNIDSPAMPIYPAYTDDPAYVASNPAITNILVAASVDSANKLTTASNWGPVHVDMGAYADQDGATSYAAAYLSGAVGMVAELIPGGPSSSEFPQVISVLKQNVAVAPQTVGAWSTTGGVVNLAFAVHDILAPDSPISINAGGGLTGSFLADTGAVTSSGGTAGPYSAVNTSGVANAAPASVYQTERYGAFTYTVPGLNPNGSYTVRLHFAENYYSGVGQRLFNVKLNGQQVLTNFDIYAAAGNQMSRAVVRDFTTVTADGAGRIAAEFIGNGSVCGIEVIPNLPAPSNLSASAASSSQINLSWSAVAGATSYQVERSPNGSSGWATVGSPAGPAFQNSGLSAGTTYYYRVRAVVSGIASSPSATASATTSSTSSTVDRTVEPGIIPDARGENAPTEGKVQAFDNNSATKWLDFSATSWLQYRLARPRVVTQYTITSANDAPERDPKGWTLKGSNDGATWTTLDTRANQAFASRFQTNTYSFSNATPYTYYRLDGIANNSGGIVQLAEFRLAGPPNSSPSATSLGQDGRDYIGSGAGSTGANGYQDIHLVLDGLPLNKTIDWIKVGGVGGGEWRYNGAYGTDKAVLVRAPGATVADLFVQPYQDETGRQYAATVYYTDGTNTGDLYTNAVFGAQQQPLPDRTSLPGGASSARGQNSPGQVVGNLFDNNLGTNWLDFSSTSWVQYQFGGGAAYAVTQYTVTSGGDTATYPGRAPKSWELKGSNDGVNWTTLDVRTNEANTANTSTRTYSFANTTAYKQYRVDNILSNGDPIVQLTEIRLLGPPVPTELAAGKATYASTIEGAGYEAGKAVDGNGTTRWSSGQWMQGGNQVGWIYVDLGASYNISQVTLNWEAAYAVNYQIQVSNDASNWTTVRSVTGNGSGGVVDHAGLAARGRYVRIYCTQVNATNNYSLYDFKVYGA